MRSPPQTGTTYVRVLNEDPDLASALDPDRLVAARLKTVAPLIRLDKGNWEPPAEERVPTRDLGLLVLDGLLFRSVEIAGRTFSELRGPEDLLRPWDDAADLASITGRITWTVAEPTRLAWLDGDFALAAAPWPEITATLLTRAIRRARLLSFELAVQELKHVHVRVLLLLWHLADRWGRVHPQGVHLELPLTHDRLARMVGAHRTSVTLAVRTLTKDGLLRRGEGGTWVLLGGPPEGLTDIEWPDAAGAALGHNA